MTNNSSSQWKIQRESYLADYKDPRTIKIVCSHKDGELLKKRPATLGEAIVHRRGVSLDWNPVRGNMNNRANRKGNYSPVAVSEAATPPSADELQRRGLPEDYLEDHDIEGLKRSGVKGMQSTRRNAVTNHYADQFICPRCTMHVACKDKDVKRVLRGLADEGVDKLDIQYIDTLVKMLPEPGFKWA